MKLANKIALAAALTAVSGLANAAVVEYAITGGNWDSITQWNAQANGAVTTTVFDNGQTPTCVGLPAEVCWIAPGGPAPGPMTGTYGGSLLVDTSTDAVVGGKLEVTGSIADAIFFAGSTKWVRQYNNLVIDFATSTATTSSNTCYATLSGAGFAPCAAIVNPATHVGIFQPLTGIASQDPTGLGGIAFLGASFTTLDGATGQLTIFRDGRNPAAPTGTDVLNQFSLQVVPVPAAVWLFGSALGLLGVARRKLAA